MLADVLAKAKQELVAAEATYGKLRQQFDSIGTAIEPKLAEMHKLELEMDKLTPNLFELRQLVKKLEA